ncbi:helix-turn-helix transcriptional regulator, partial [Thioclava sp. BHET1]
GIAQRLLSLRDDRRVGGGSFALDIGTRRVDFTYLSPVGPGEFLYRVNEDVPGGREAILREAFALTMREAEVLLWLAAGKANRDISEILDISPRTVKKHLEQVFVKLGVENRATAAALAVKALADRE